MTAPPAHAHVGTEVIVSNIDQAVSETESALSIAKALPKLKEFEVTWRGDKYLSLLVQDWLSLYNF